jgi:hypothetical protein
MAAPPSPSAGPVLRGWRPSRVRPRSLLLHVGLLLSLSLAAAGAAGLLLWWGLGRPDLAGTAPGPTIAPAPTVAPVVTSPPRPLTPGERLDSMKVILAVVGGIGAVVALTVAYRKQRVGELSEYREDTRLYTDRFGKAADQLGTANGVVQVAGVHAMAELADDWQDGRQLCIEVLCSYLRMPYEADPAAADYVPERREARRTLIRVIRNHLRPGWSAVSWCGYRFSFEGAVFDCGDLSGARLQGGNMTFHGAQFVGDGFEFSGVSFDHTPVWFTKVRFGGATVTFRGAQFAGSDVRFDGAKFTGGSVTFDGAEHRAGNVTFNGAEHTGGSVEWGPFPPLPPPGSPPTP